MPTRGKNNPNGRALRGRRAHTTFISDPIAQLWSNYNVRSGATGAIAPEQPAVQDCLYDRFEALYKKSSIKPSLLIVPARFQGGSLYSQLPTSGAGDFTVTRATAATRVNASGLIESVASGIPRLDYFASGGTVGCPALLVEPSAQNLALQSENFLTTWSPTNITVTTGSTAAFTAPDGTTSADLLTASASGSARIIQSFSFVSGTTYTYSAFAKAGSGFFGLTMENGGVASGAAVIWNLNTGALAVSGTAGAGYTLQSQGIENYGNGWYRCRMTVLLGLSAAGNIRANTSDGTMLTAVIQSASGNTAYVWGAQLETGSIATSYIPTTTAAVTRNADVVSVSGAVSGSIGQASGTIYAEVDLSRITTNAILSLNDGTGTNRFIIQFFSSTVLLADIRVAGVNANYSVTIPAIPANGGIYKVALGYKANDYCFALNGTTYASTASRGVPATTQINLGNYLSSNQFNDRIRAVALYTTRLTNEQLAFITQP